MSTTNLGLNLLATTSPDYEGGVSPIALMSANMTTLDGKFNVEAEAADGAIGITQGLAAITKGSAAALTLAAPASGLPAASGNNGQILRMIATTAFAHTVTTPSNKINGNKHVLTFAAVGDSAVLVAFGGVWYFDSASSSAVLS